MSATQGQLQRFRYAHRHRPTSRTTYQREILTRLSPSSTFRSRRWSGSSGQSRKSSSETTSHTTTTRATLLVRRQARSLPAPSMSISSTSKTKSETNDTRDTTNSTCHRIIGAQVTDPTRRRDTPVPTPAPTLLNSRRPRFQRDRASPSASAWEVGRKTNLRRGIDGRHVDPASRLLHPPLCQSPARSQASDPSDLFPHRASPSTAVLFKSGGSLSRHIETKLPIREVLEKFVDIKKRLAGSHSKTPGEKGRLLDSVSKTVHDVLFATHQCSGDPDSDNEADLVAGGPEFKAYVTSLHQSGHQAHLGSRTHSNSDFRGAL